MVIRLDELPPESAVSPLPEGAKAPTTSVRLDDLNAMQDGQKVQQEDFDLSNLSFTEAEANVLKAKGKIGHFEQAVRMKKMEKVPVVGLPFLLYEAAAVQRSFTRLQKDEYGDNDELRVKDMETAEKAIKYAGEEQLRGFTWGGQVVEGAAQLPAYMVEFALSKFFADPGATTAARFTAKQLLKMGVKKGAQKFAAGATKMATAAAIRTGTVFAPRVATGFYEQEAALNLTPTDKGLQLNEQVQSAPVTSFMKALGDVYIEVFSEEAGKYIFNPAFKKMGSAKFLAGTGKVIKDMFKKLHPLESVGKLFTKTGWDGFIPEVLEEVWGDQMRAFFNVEDFGSDGGTLDRMIAAVPSGDELAVMMGVLAVPGATHLGMQQGFAALNRYQQAKKKAGVPEARTKAQEILREEVDPVERAVEDATAPLPQVELSKEELEQLTIKKREGGVEFDASKPAPERKVVDEITSSKEFKEADREKQMELLIRGRTAELDVQRTAIEKEMTALEKDVKQLQKSEDKTAAKVVEQKQKQLVSLSKQLMSVHAQLSDVTDSTAEELAREKLVLPGETLETLRGRARKVGERMARSETETVFRNEKAQAEERRTALVKYLQARLPGPENAKLREKFTLRAAKDMTEAKLQKFFAEVEKLRETVRAKQLRQRATSITERMRSKVVNGVKRGAFANANIQRLADEVIRVASLSRPDAEKELADVHNQIVKLLELGEGQSEAADELRYRADILSKISGLEQRNADELETAIDAISRQLAQFQTGRDVVKELRKAQRKAEEVSTVSEIKKVSWEPKSGIGKIFKKASRGISSFFEFSAFNLGEFWGNLGGGKEGSFIDRMVVQPLKKISRNTAAIQIAMDRKVRQAMLDIYEIPMQNTRKYVKFLTERMSIEPSDDPNVSPYIATVVLNNGETKQFKMSRWDVLYWYASAYQGEGVQDAEAYETLTGENELAAIRTQAELEGSGAKQTSDLEDLREIVDMMSFAEPNPLVDDGEGGSGKTRLGGGHIAQFLRGEKTAVVEVILQKMEAGKELTEKQNEKLQELLSGYRTEVLGQENATEDSIDDKVAERAKGIKGNAIPAEVLENMFADLTPQDRQFAMEMRKIFTSFWPLINPVYARATGVDMTNIESYMPRIKKTASVKSVQDLLTEYSMIEAHVTPFPGSTKERRTTSTAPFAQIGMMDVFMGFRDIMSHWIATHDITARMQGYLRNRAVRDAINEATDGVQDKATGEWRDGSYVKMMDFHLKGLASRGRTDNNIRPPAMDLLRRNLSRSVLAKPKQFVLQLSSAFTAIQSIGHVNFVKGIASFMRDPAGANKLLSKALSQHNRYKNIMIEMKEIQDLIRLQRTRFRDKFNWFDKYAFMFVRGGNRGGILIGGWAVFKEAYDRTNNIDTAYEAFDNFVLNSQQSALREQQSAATVGPQRYLFQFISAVSQFARQYHRSWTKMIKDPSAKNVQQWARTMVIFHVYIPAARWAISQIGVPPPEDEEDEAKRLAMLGAQMMTGPFAGLWILGDIGSFAAQAITGYKGFDSGPAVVQAMNKAKKTTAKAIRKAFEEDVELEDVMKQVFKAGKQDVGLTTGMPSGIIDSIQALYLHSEGEWDPVDTPGLLYGQSVEMINYHRGVF